MENHDNECKPCHSGRTPWLVCFLLGVEAGFYDAVGEKLLKSPDSGDKAAGYVAKGFGKVIDVTQKFYCQY